MGGEGCEGREGEWVMGRMSQRGFTERWHGAKTWRKVESGMRRHLLRGAFQAEEMTNVKAPERAGAGLPCWRGARLPGQLKGTGERGGPQSGHCKGLRCYFEGDGEPLEGLSRGASWSNCHLEEWLCLRGGEEMNYDGVKWKGQATVIQAWLCQGGSGGDKWLDYGLDSGFVLRIKLTEFVDGWMWGLWEGGSHQGRIQGFWPEQLEGLKLPFIERGSLWEEKVWCRGVKGGAGRRRLELDMLILRA